MNYILQGDRMKTMISQEVANALDTSVRKATVIVESVLNEVKQGLINDGKVTLRGFGSFQTRTKKKRMGRNPKTGEDAVISARTVLTFKASKLFKSKVNQPDDSLSSQNL